MSKKAAETHLQAIPKGYMKGNGTDGTTYLVPQMLVPDLHQSFAAHREKTVLNVVNAKPTYNNALDFDIDLVGGLFPYPPNPVLTERERLSAHAEITALQQQLGISYKDASHRLYMAEIERLKVLDLECKAWANLSENLKTSLKNIDVEPVAKEESKGKGKAKAKDVDSGSENVSGSEQ